MLRALFVIAAILVGIRYSARGPFYALLFYLWIAYFRPEYWLWWDFFSALNLSLLVGIVVVGSSFLAGERLRFGVAPALMMLLVCQSLLSVLTSRHADYAFLYWQDFAKSTLISALMVALVSDERRLRLTFLIIAFSLGLEATKQGWAQLILNPGGANYNDHPAIGDNNAVAVGMLMLISMMIGLARTAGTRWERLIHRFTAVGVVYRAISTYSRGGFLAALAMGLHFLAFSKRKLSAALGVVFVIALILPALPDAFWDRMSTIPTSTEELDDIDRSSASRLHFWRVAVAMANANPLTGVGHMAYNRAYNEYDFLDGAYGPDRSVHSSWFGVLAELGYPGLLLFGAIFVHAVVACRRAQRAAKRHPELRNLGVLGAALESALVAFAVGGAFVILQYTEILWHTMALAFATDRIVAERAAALNVQAAPVAAAAGTPSAALPAIMPVPIAARRRDHAGA